MKDGIKTKDMEDRMGSKINSIRVSEKEIRENEGEASIQNWKISTTLQIRKVQRISRRINKSKIH